MKENKIEILDNIRGIACIIVLFAHIVASSPYIGVYANGCGKIGVWCFMVMSGFLSMYPYISRKKDCTDYNSKSVITYYLKKIKTLYPAFLLALLLAMYTGLVPSAESFLMHLLCVESIGHFWYMPVIIKFYIIFPLFVVLYRLVKKSNLLYGIWVSIILLALGVIFPFERCAENSNQLRWYVPVFCMGILLALIYDALKDKLSEMLIFDVTSILFVVGIMIFTPYFRQVIWDIQPGSWLQNKYILMGALWCGVIFSLAFSKVFKNVLIKSKIFAWISTISYELYLIHFTVLLKLNLLISDMTIKAILVIVISVVLSILLHSSIGWCDNTIKKLAKK